MLQNCQSLCGSNKKISKRDPSFYCIFRGNNLPAFCCWRRTKKWAGLSVKKACGSACCLVRNLKLLVKSSCRVGQESGGWMQMAPSRTTAGQVLDVNSGNRSMSFSAAWTTGIVGSSKVPGTSEILFTAEWPSCRSLARVMSASSESEWAAHFARFGACFYNPPKGQVLRTFFFLLQHGCVWLLVEFSFVFNRLKIF